MTDYAAQHFVGMRIFTLDYDKMLLQSLTGNGGDTCWMPGQIKRSVCGQAYAHRHEHLKPAIDCTCGIWSCKSRRTLAAAFPMLAGMGYLVGLRSYSPRYISAQVEQWGVVIEHEQGYRSEYARIIPESIQEWPRSKDSWRNRKLVNLLREKYTFYAVTEGA